MRRLRSSDINAALLPLACFLPEVGLFVDGAILPKWYMAALAACALAVQAASGRLDRGSTWTYFHASVLAAAAATSIWAITEWAVGSVTTPHAQFDNPAALAISLCCALSLMIFNRALLPRKLQWAFYPAIALTLTAIATTQSRICILASAVITLVHLFQLRKRLMAGAFIVLASAALSVLMSRKSDSTSGRGFILKRTWEMVAEHPVGGWGINGYRRNYMLRQAAFFQEHPHDEAAWLADDISHPLCEYLLWWVDFGVMGLLVLGIIFFLPCIHTSRTDVRTQCAALAITALASYPLHYPISWLTLAIAWKKAIPRVFNFKRQQLAVIIAAATASIVIITHAATTLIQQQAERAALAHRHKTALRLFRKIEPLCSANPYFLYSYCRECYTVGRFGQALSLNDQCSEYWNSYDLTLLRADILAHLARWTDAEAAYLLAKRMCPVRFAPLEGLMRTYDAIGDTKKLQNIAQEIIDKPVKVPSQTIDDIKEKARVIVDANITDAID